MIATEYPYAGLILPDAQDLDPRPYLRSARTVLSRLDPHPGGGTRLIEAASMVVGGMFGLRVTPQEESDYGPRMMLEVVASDGTPTKDEAAAQILSDTVLNALESSPADIIEWYSPDVLLDTQDFIRLRSYVSPRRKLQTAPYVTAIQSAQSNRTLPEPAPLISSSSSAISGAEGIMAQLNPEKSRVATDRPPARSTTKTSAVAALIAPVKLRLREIGRLFTQ